MSSAVPPTDSAQTASPAPKKKNNKKKKGNKPKPVETQQDGGQPEQDDASDDPDTPGANTTDQPNPPESATISESNGNGHATGGLVNGHGSESDAPPGDTSAKLAAMTEEREALRSEVEKLRKQLETLQESQSIEVTQLQTDLEESEAAREQVQSQYDTLMGRVEKIKETTMTRLKKDKEELNEAKDRIEELETQIEDLQRGAQASDGDATRLREELQEATRELTSLRSRNNLSQQNWLKEKDDQARQMQHLRSELESTSTAMGEWEVIAMEERSVREGLAEKVADLEEQLTSLREAHDHATSELDTQARSTDRLQRALQEIQEARKRELREMVESSEEQLEAMKLRVQEADARAAAAETERAALAEELTRTAPFEKEVKEKSLLLGKLRHETIVLNDHLTRALKYIKKNRPEENVDREVVSNHFLQFLGLDRSDPRKFQILQVIAGLLHWTEEQREQAGLARPGTGSLRLPASPFHRTPSTPSLNTEFFSEPTPSASGRESLADLWADFLERSVEEAGVPGGPPAARRGSAASSVAGSVARPDTRGG